MTAASGREAVDRRAQQSGFDLPTSLGGDERVEVCRKIRENAATAMLPVVMVQRSIAEDA